MPVAVAVPRPVGTTGGALLSGDVLGETLAPGGTDARPVLTGGGAVPAAGTATPIEPTPSRPEPPASDELPD
jgi:hypothetical protein